MPAWLRRLVGIGVAGLLIPALRLTSRQAGVVIAYHAIDVREGDPRRELVPPTERSRFRRQLRHLTHHYELVPASAFREAVAARRRGGRFPVCVTFDDDLAEHVKYALPILEEEGVAATFFLCGASLKSAKSFWWERLQRAVDEGVPLRDLVDLLPPQGGSGPGGGALDIHMVAAAIQMLAPRERDQVDAQLLGFAGPDPPEAGLRADDVAILAGGRCAIGFHTVRHDELVNLDEGELEQAMRVGRSDLESVVGHPIDLIAYPHGSADRRVAEAARRAGFRSGLTGTRCAVTPGSHPLLMGRLSADDKPSLGEFALALVGTLLIGPACDEVGS